MQVLSLTTYEACLSIDYLNVMDVVARTRHVSRILDTVAVKNIFIQLLRERERDEGGIDVARTSLESSHPNHFGSRASRISGGFSTAVLVLEYPT